MSDAVQHNKFIVDGVLVHHFPTNEELTSVCLLFAAGVRDEGLPSFGSLHALEHLCLTAVRDTALEINGSVDRLTTQFTAYGRPGLVGPWLERLCRALAQPPVDRLEAEAPVLLAEGEGIGTPADSLNLVRFGNRDLGLGLAPTPTPRSLAVEQLVGDASRWFATGNAVLIVDGPLPELRLPLRAGTRLSRDWPAPLRLTRPEALLLDVDCVAVNLILPPPDPTGLDSLAGRLLENRIEEAIRHGRGLAYHVDSEGWPTAGRSTALTLWAEPGHGNHLAASNVLLDCVSELLANGPSADELDLAREQVLASTSGREGAIGSVVHAALSELLFGTPDPHLQPELLTAARAQTVNAYLRALAEDVLYLLHEKADQLVRDHQIPTRQLEPQQPSLPAGGMVYRPPLPARLISAVARTVKLVTTDDALWLQVGNEVTRVRWVDAAGLLDNKEDGMTVLYSIDGTAIAVDDRISGSNRALDTIRRHIPTDLWYFNEPENHETSTKGR